MREQTNVSLTITSTTLTVEELTAKIGLAPDTSWRAGTSRGLFGVTAKENGYVLESTQSMQASLDEHIKGLLQRCAPYAQKIGELGADVEFACALHRRSSPPLRLGRDDVRWLAVMGAHVALDTLILVEPAKAPPSKPGSGL